MMKKIGIVLAVLIIASFMIGGVAAEWPSSECYDVYSTKLVECNYELISVEGVNCPSNATIESWYSCEDYAIRFDSAERPYYRARQGCGDYECVYHAKHFWVTRENIPMDGRRGIFKQLHVCNGAYDNI